MVIKDKILYAKFKNFGETLPLYRVNNLGLKLVLISSLHLFSSDQRRNYIFP